MLEVGQLGDVLFDLLFPDFDDDDALPSLPDFPLELAWLSRFLDICMVFFLCLLCFLDSIKLPSR